MRDRGTGQPRPSDSDNAASSELGPGGANPNGANAGGANRGPTLSGESAIVGEDFRGWLEQLEDVEALVPEGRLREEAARIRQRATEMRRDFLRHSLPPQSAELEAAIAEPLRRLSAEVAAERRRLEGDDVSVRLDQDPIPPGWETQVRRYFENLGVGRE